jgi:hypothetical protein
MRRQAFSGCASRTTFGENGRIDVNWNPNRYPLAPASHDHIRVSKEQEGELQESWSDATQAPSQTVPDFILEQTDASGTRPGGTATSPLETIGQSSPPMSRRAIWANWNPNAWWPDQTSDLDKPASEPAVA